MTSSQLLLLPAEVLLHVGEHLDRRTLYAAIQTSTLLYTTFTPLLWRTITLDDSSKHQVCFEALQSRAEHVYDLSLKTFLPSYYTLAFPRLSSLSILNDYSFLCAPTFVQRNPTIKDLFIIDRQSLPTKDFWNAVYSEWLQPRSLTVQELNVTERAADAFWKACTRFETLRLSFHAPSASLPKDLAFPLVTHLDLKLDHQRTEPFFAEEQLAFIKSCPSLTSLCWSLDHFDSPMLQFQDALAHKTWAQLTDLELRGSRHLDAEMAAVMGSLPPLRRLVLSQCSFGPLTFSKLKERHFATLEVLDVVGCEEFFSAMAMDVLSRCPRLQEFSCPQIRLKDLVQSPQEQQQQQPFACQSHLRYLDVFISKDDTDPDDWTVRAMERLSTLTQLEQLSLSPARLEPECQIQTQNQVHVTNNRVGSGLDLCLKNGLDRLSSLSKMSFFEFGDSSPRMGMEEAQWMVQSWRQLKSVVGHFSETDDCSIDKFAVVFDQRDITYVAIQSNSKIE
ncbi:hypothetical protein BGZ97_002325 [Linnemannia gamsii]|jgi:hypothetical protein|uniref:F-box domain-containing protein n=1 Tax=Linnemannia gamsii TaxID=64522 RepID=A0A9P6UIK9_9FUNG|nr:hypothetical protein BGZ97_002325 [Linnemannia gamsii]